MSEPMDLDLENLRSREKYLVCCEKELERLHKLEALSKITDREKKQLEVIIGLQSALSDAKKSERRALMEKFRPIAEALREPSNSHLSWCAMFPKSSLEACDCGIELRKSVLDLWRSLMKENGQ